MNVHVSLYSYVNAKSTISEAIDTLNLYIDEQVQKAAELYTESNLQQIMV